MVGEGVGIGESVRLAEDFTVWIDRFGKRIFRQGGGYRRRPLRVKEAVGARSNLGDSAFTRGEICRHRLGLRARGLER